MNQCICLPGVEEDFFLTSLSDTTQSSQSSGISTPVQSSENEQAKDGFQTCLCTRETLGCSIHPNTREEYIHSMRASLARILAKQGSKLELAKAHEAACIGKSSASLTWLDRESCTWKTWQRSLLTDWTPFSQTFPRAGILHDGYVYELPMLVRIMEGTDGGCLQEKWATPRANSAMAATITAESAWNKDRFPNLETQVGRKTWPTPNCAAAGTPKGKMQPMLGNHPDVRGTTPEEWAGGTLNPTWVEWLMGWPLGFTDLKD